ncbi:MAG: hypothetical protein JW747_08345 [Candidatus Aminicenantes bacterium]|nr:hypothetical protein [Candidatus Aminicenantes bacterium]
MRKTDAPGFYPGLVDALSLIYGFVPSFLKKALLPGAESAASTLRRLFLVLSQLRLPVRFVQGKEKSGGRELTAFIAGRGRAASDIAGILFSEVRAEKTSGALWLWDLKSVLSRFESRADMAFVVLDELWAKALTARGFLMVPEWVTFRMDLTRPLARTWNLSRNKTLRENLRRIRKHRYSYEITRDPKKFDDFYRCFYLPFIPEKFGDSTVLTGYRLMKLFFQSGVLLLVKQDGEFVSGNIIMLYNKGAKSIIIGVREGRADYIRKAALAASYYFTTQWAVKQGFRWIDFGECRPYLNDGILYFKKRWGMRVERYRHNRTVIALKVRASSPTAEDFLADNPLIYLNGKALRGLVFARGDRPLDSRDVLSLEKSFFVPGLENLTVVSPRGYAFTAEAVRDASSRRTLRLLEGGGEEFMKDFPKSLRPGKTQMSSEFRPRPGPSKPRG